MDGADIVNSFAPPLVLLSAGLTLVSFVCFILGVRMLHFLLGSGQQLQRPGNDVHYRLGVRTYVELPELLKTFDLEVPQVCLFCFLERRLPG